MIWLRVFFLLIVSVFQGDSLFIQSKNLKGIKSIIGLTEKQLAIQRWFAQLTYLPNQIDLKKREKERKRQAATAAAADDDDDEWKGWGEAVKDIHCDGNTCIRYEISGLFYGVAILATKTPAYRQVTSAIMFNAIERMISKTVWEYIEIFDDFKSQPSYPDPVAYKNIMYSGHLAQV
jgi:hypothetical protein